MIYAILIILAAVLLAVCILQNVEMKNIAEQLKKIGNEDTNSLVRSSSGTADKLIVQINFLLREIQSAKAEYSRKQHALDQMITNISHDLRTPLTSALGYIDLVKDPSTQREEKLRELEIIRKRLLRLEELINSFFELSKIISMNEPPEMQNQNIISILERSAANYYDDYCAAEKAVQLGGADKKIFVITNENMLMRIFDNIIGNALKHGSGDLLITVGENEDKAEIIFENPTENQPIDTERIFDEFYTTELSRTKGGNGLGLAIAKQFALILGAEISAEYESGVFRIKFAVKKQRAMPQRNPQK